MAALVLIVMQTTVTGDVRGLANFYDPVLIVVVCLALFHPLWPSLAVILLTGLLMNHISAAPPGLYFFSYLWLFLLVRWSAMIFHVANILILSILFAAVVFGQALFWGAGVALTASTPIFGRDIVYRAAHQLLWALFTGAIGVRALRAIQLRAQCWLEHRLSHRRGPQ